MNAESKEFALASYKQGLAEGYAILETWVKERIEYAVSDEQLADQLRVKFDMASTANTPTTEGK